MEAFWFCFKYFRILINSFCTTKMTMKITMQKNQGSNLTYFLSLHRRNPSLRPDGEYEPVYWPVHTATGREYLTLAVNSTDIGRARRARECAFWSDYLPKLVQYTGMSKGRSTKFRSSRLLYHSFSYVFKFIVM